MKYCRKCGTPNNDDNGICIFCQALLQPVARRAEEITETTIKDLESALREAETKRRLNDFLLLSLIFIIVFTLEMTISSFVAVKYQTDVGNLQLSVEVISAVNTLLIVSYTSLGVISLALLSSLVFLIFSAVARFHFGELAVSRFGFANNLRKLSIIMLAVSSAFTAMYITEFSFTLLFILRHGQAFPATLIIGVFAAAIPLIGSIAAYKIAVRHKQCIYEDLLNEQNILNGDSAVSPRITGAVTDVSPVKIEPLSRGFLYEDFLPYSTPVDEYMKSSGDSANKPQPPDDADAFDGAQADIPKPESDTHSEDNIGEHAAFDEDDITKGIFEEPDSLARVVETMPEKDTPTVWLSDKKEDKNKKGKKAAGKRGNEKKSL